MVRLSLLDELYAMTHCNILVFFFPLIHSENLV